MKKYIEREVVIEKTEWFCDNFVTNWTDEKVLAWIKHFPAADVVEVVRCKDCRRRYNADECPMCVLIDGEYHEYTNGNGFCDRGERRSHQNILCDQTEDEP